MSAQSSNLNETRCTYFQPMANPQAGSRKRVEYAEKDPETGKTTAISPRAWTVQNIMIPIIPKAMTSDAGPPVERAAPEVTKRPVPAIPRQNVVPGFAELIG